MYAQRNVDLQRFIIKIYWQVSKDENKLHFRPIHMTMEKIGKVIRRRHYLQHMPSFYVTVNWRHLFPNNVHLFHQHFTRRAYQSLSRLNLTNSLENNFSQFHFHFTREVMRFKNTNLCLTKLRNSSEYVKKYEIVLLWNKQTINYCCNVKHPC